MDNATCFIPLTQGQFAIVSPEDYEFLMQWKWCAKRKPVTYGFIWYAYRSVRVRGQKIIKGFYMHREIVKRFLPGYAKYDHKDRNGLNNTRDNLRHCTSSQNTANTTKSLGCSSKFKGVAWYKNSHSWVARITVNGKVLYLGDFQSEQAAHEAYTVAAYRYFGEFACP